MMAIAYRQASIRHRPSPSPNPDRPFFSVRNPTPASVTAAHSSARRSGAVRCSTASNSGTMTMAVLVRNDTVEAVVMVSPNTSQVITAKNAPPKIMPWSRSVFVTWRSFFQKMTHSTAKARQNRTASRFRGLMLSSPTLANNSDVLLAKMTPASSHSAAFLLIWYPSHDKLSPRETRRWGKAQPCPERLG